MAADADKMDGGRGFARQVFMREGSPVNRGREARPESVTISRRNPATVIAERQRSNPDESRPEPSSGFASSLRSLAMTRPAGSTNKTIPLDIAAAPSPARHNAICRFGQIRRGRADRRSDDFKAMPQRRTPPAKNLDSPNIRKFLFGGNVEFQGFMRRKNLEKCQSCPGGPKRSLEICVFASRPVVQQDDPEKNGNVQELFLQIRNMGVKNSLKT